MRLHPRISCWLVAGAASVLTIATSATALAQQQQQSVGGIYTCKDKFGRNITSDRPIVECMESGQRILNTDGSTKNVILTPEQERRLQKERQDREAEAERVYEKRRRDRNLMQRYPNEAAWDRAAMDMMLEPFQIMESAQKRIVEFNKDAKQLQDEAEFYKKGKMPLALKRKIDDNRIAIDSENKLIETKRTEIKQLQSKMTQELIELRKMWAERGR